MRQLNLFDAKVVNAFEGSQANADEFNSVLIDAAKGNYETYSKTESDKMIRNLFDKISGVEWAKLNPMQRRQDFRLHSAEYYSVIEDVLADKLVSGWPENAFFEQFVEEKNLGLGDKNEFYVEENSLMQISKFAGNHHDIIRQKVGFGRSFSVETSRYAVKCYNDYELFRAGKIDFAKMIAKMYASIEKYRQDAIYVAFMSAPEALPTDLVLETAINTNTVAAIKELIEEVKTATGKDIALVGTRVALDKLTATVAYEAWSNEMKNEKHTTGQLGTWEGYTLMAIPRVNAINSRTEITDNTKILIVPIDPEFKPIKRVNEGDVAFFETGMDGSKKDMTISAEIAYMEGIAVVINMLYGEIDILA